MLFSHCLLKPLTTPKDAGGVAMLLMITCLEGYFAQLCVSWFMHTTTNPALAHYLLQRMLLCTGTLKLQRLQKKR